jgi:hypothetical protein
LIISKKKAQPVVYFKQQAVMLDYSFLYICNKPNLIVLNESLANANKSIDLLNSWFLIW